MEWGRTRNGSGRRGGVLELLSPSRFEPQRRLGSGALERSVGVRQRPKRVAALPLRIIGESRTSASVCCEPFRASVRERPRRRSSTKATLSLFLALSFSFSPRACLAVQRFPLLAVPRPFPSFALAMQRKGESPPTPARPGARTMTRPSRAPCSRILSPSCVLGGVFFSSFVPVFFTVRFAVRCCRPWPLRRLLRLGLRSLRAP